MKKEKKNESDPKSNFVVKTKFKLVFLRWLGLILAQYAVGAGMIFGQLRRAHTTGYIFNVILAVFLAMFPAALLVSLFGYKRIIVKGNVIKYRTLLSGYSIRVSQITDCMISGNILYIWSGSVEYRIMTSDFDYGEFKVLRTYLRENGIDVKYDKF